MIADVEAGLIDTICVKDMSRLGRNYLKVGYYTEILFPEKGIRFIAINNGIDSDVPTDNDFTPFLNIMNEWYAKDTRQDERHTIYFENHFVACDVCFGSNKTVYGVPCRNISSYRPGNCRDFSSDSFAELWLWSGKFRGMPENGIGWIPVLSTAKYG